MLQVAIKAERLESNHAACQTRYLRLGERLRPSNLGSAGLRFSLPAAGLVGMQLLKRVLVPSSDGEIGCWLQVRSKALNPVVSTPQPSASVRLRVDLVRRVLNPVWPAIAPKEPWKLDTVQADGEPSAIRG